MQKARKAQRAQRARLCCGKVRKAQRARLWKAQTAQRARLWKEGVVFWPPYADYQVKAGSREIPVVVLDPIS